MVVMRAHFFFWAKKKNSHRKKKNFNKTHYSSTMASPQREGFSIPSSISHAALGQVQSKSLGVKYNCAQCAASFSLSKSDTIRCKECGHRVIYKARTKRMVQFEAR